MIPYKEILLLLFSSLIAFLTWRLQHQKDKLKNIESQLSDRKYKMYSELLYILFDISNGDKIGKPVPLKELSKRYNDIKKDMFLYAPDEIFQTYTQWLLVLSKDGTGINHFKTYYTLLKLVRKDMGQVKTKISLDDFMLFYMQNESEYNKFKQANNWQ